MTIRMVMRKKETEIKQQHNNGFYPFERALHEEESGHIILILALKLTCSVV